MNQNEIIIGKHKLKQIGILSGALVFVFLGFLMIKNTSSGFSFQLDKLYGFIGIFFFGLIALFTAINLLSSTPALIINVNGITNKLNFSGSYTVDWDNIKSFNIVTLQKQRMIAIYLKDDNAVSNQGNSINRFLMKLNQRYMGTPVLISSVMIDSKLDDLLNIIQEQKKANINYKKRLKLYQNV